MTGSAIAIVIVIIIIIIWFFWSRRQRDPVAEHYAVVYAKLDRSRAYDGYQNHLIRKCVSALPSQQVTPEDQAKLISLREMSPTLTQRVNDLGGALIKIQSRRYADGASNENDIATIERILLVNSAIDNLWMLQCEQDKRLMNIKSFQFVYPE